MVESSVCVVDAAVQMQQDEVMRLAGTAVLRTSRVAQCDSIRCVTAPVELSSLRSPPPPFPPSRRWIHWSRC